MLFGENSQFVDVEILVNGVFQETLKFNSPPLNIEEVASGQKLRRRIESADGEIVFQWDGTPNDGLYADKVAWDGEKWTAYDVYLKKWGETNYSLVVQLPVLQHYDTDADGPFTCSFDVDYYAENYDEINDQIIFTDSNSTYTYFLQGLTYNVKPDGLSSGGDAGILYQASSKSIVEFSVNGFIRLILSSPPLKISQTANLFTVEDESVKYSFDSESTIAFQVLLDSCEQPAQCSLIQSKYPGYSCVSCN